MTGYPYTRLRDIPDKIAQLESFDGNSMSGYFFSDGAYGIQPGRGNESPPNGSIYIVWSYGTPIAWIDQVGRAYRVPHKFSVTTSKHQSILHTLKDLTSKDRERLGLDPTCIIHENPYT